MPRIDLPAFIDFDTCHLCRSHNGPFVWITDYRARKGKEVYYICEDCYNKIFKDSKKTRG